jgi:hypothetical protein
MTQVAKNIPEEGGKNNNRTFLLWLLGGTSLGLTTIFVLVLLIFFIVSVILNTYLTWRMAGVEVAISRADSELPEAMVIAPNNVLVTPVVMIVSATPQPEVANNISTSTEPVLDTQPDTPTDAVNTSELQPSDAAAPVKAILSPLEIQHSTVAAIATESIMVANGAPPRAPVVVPNSTPIPGVDSEAPGVVSDSSLVNDTEEVSASAPTATPLPSSPTPYVSTNTYELIPLEGDRDSRPAPQHADLNLKLREPELFDAELTLQDFSGATDVHAPRLTEVFQPEFLEIYTLYNWDWATDRPSDLTNEVNLVVIKTTPGEPVYIPAKNQDIFQGKFYATLLYATEDQLTFAYTRDGTVAHGYAVHYMGLQTDPNLLELYRESKGNQLPGLTLDTPVGIATDQLIVAIRDRGKFMDVRSKKDWWGQ